MFPGQENGILDVPACQRPPNAAGEERGAAAIRQKVEIRFEKGEAVRFISHHDLMRAFQRAVRRAALPVRLTEGFNPRPRIVFPAALEVGIASLDEAAEIELTTWIQPNELMARLAHHIPPGLTIRGVKELPSTRKGQTPRRMTYRLHLAEAGVRLTREMLAQALRTPALIFLRMRPDKEKPGKIRTLEVDLKPLVAAAILDEDTGVLEVAIAVTPQATARPLEVLSVLTGTPLEQLKQVRVTKLESLLEPPPQPPA